LGSGDRRDGEREGKSQLFEGGHAENASRAGRVARMLASFPDSPRSQRGRSERTMRGRSALVSLFWFSSSWPDISLARQSAGARRLQFDVGRNHFSFLIHFGPKVLGGLPKLLSPCH
jgi:hypothetical protein